jgi:metal-responsive CopG/Arc/MetJ family transcriptional regulator
MKSVLVQMDDHLYDLLNRIAPPAGRKRAQFIRNALLRALMEAQEANTRAAYLAAPDSEIEADDWAAPEEFRA